MSLGRPSPELLPHRPGCGWGPGLERGRLGVAALLLVHRSACAGVFCGAPVSAAKLATGTGGIQPFTGICVVFRPLNPVLKQVSTEVSAEVSLPETLWRF